MSNKDLFVPPFENRVLVTTMVIGEVTGRGATTTSASASATSPKVPRTGAPCTSDDSQEFLLRCCSRNYGESSERTWSRVEKIDVGPRPMRVHYVDTRNVPIQGV